MTKPTTAATADATGMSESGPRYMAVRLGSGRHGCKKLARPRMNIWPAGTSVGRAPGAVAGNRIGTQARADRAHEATTTGAGLDAVRQMALGDHRQPDESHLTRIVEANP